MSSGKIFHFLKWNKYNFVQIPLQFSKQMSAAFACDEEDLMALGIHGCMDNRDDLNSLASCPLSQPLYEIPILVLSSQ